MSRYSSDSDSSGTRRRSRRRSRRSSSSSNSSSSHRHRKKSSRYHGPIRHKKASKSYSGRSYRRSRSHSKNSSRHSRSLSRERERRRRRSNSRDKTRQKYHHSSRSHSKGHSSKYQSRSSSNDSNSRHSRSNSSSSSSPKRLPLPVINSGNSEEQLREKLMKAIKAAESADHQLKQQGVLPKGVKSRNDLSNLANLKPQGDVIKDINTDEFIPKSFTSSKNKRNIVIDDTLGVDQVVSLNSEVMLDKDSIFHASFFVDPKIKLERWVKKLHQIRQKAVFGEPLLS